jgi:hypothetical protein
MGTFVQEYEVVFLESLFDELWRQVPARQVIRACERAV